jgi:hypothetical protein
VQMPDAWGYVEGARPENLCDAHVLHSARRELPFSCMAE